MTETFKKIEKTYILSDSSVNEYGFRLLTSGYQMDAYQKNPIGYYMHRRDDGVILKWDELRIEDDTIVGVPVINLAHERGEQTCSEVENGFLNAASVGHIVVLEYSTEPEQMLPGQTGPTITKWYNKECSLVDIPGNCNALAKLYDAQENEINLMDLNIKPVLKNKISEIKELLHLTDNTDEALLTTVKDISLKAAKADELMMQNQTLQSDKNNLLQQIAELRAAQSKTDITLMLDHALKDKKITKELHGKLQVDYAENAEGLKLLLQAMPAYQSILDTLKASEHKKEMQWSWDDFEQYGKTGKKLQDLKLNHPERYQEIFKDKFGN